MVSRLIGFTEYEDARVEAFVYSFFSFFFSLLFLSFFFLSRYIFGLICFYNEAPRRDVEVVIAIDT